MKRLLNRLRHLLRSRLLAGMLELPTPAPETAPEWNADHRAALLYFLKSPTGHAVLQTLRHNEELLKATACDSEQRRVDHARGRAVGYREAAATLIILSAPLPPPPSGEESAQDATRGPDDLRERLAP